jgi:CDP-ribitol ribitolphosphotransferase / teichoic acid ribitol-phosphate polymerase
VKAAAIRIATALLSAFYRLCRLLPARKRIVMLSRQSNQAPVDFTLLAKWVAREHPDWRCVILAKKLSGPLYAFHMLRQIYHIARARAVVLDSYCIVVSLLDTRISAPVLQMWHALGNMKKFGYTALDTPGGHSSATAQLMHMHAGYDSILCSSLSFVDDIRAGFAAPREKMHEAPLPRVDLLVDPDVRAARRAEIYAAYPELAGKKTIVYCPTFRRDEPDGEKAALQALVDAVDFTRYNLVFKKHPVSRLHIDDTRVLQDYDPTLDMLYAADYAISDYSTVIYEAGLLGVPVFLYAWDWEAYREKLELYIDIEHDVPTLFSGDAKAIMAAIEADDFDRGAFAAFTAKNVAVPVGTTCTERVGTHLFSMIEQGKCNPR